MKRLAPVTRLPLLAVALTLCALLGFLPTTANHPLGSWSGTNRAEASPAQAAGPVIVPGELLFKPRGDPGSALAALPPELKPTVLDTLDPLGIVRLAVPAGREAEAAAALRKRPHVEWAEPNELRRAMAVPNDQLYKQFQWNFRKIGLEQAWDVTTGSADLVVAVLDTGVDASHPDLAGKLIPGYDFLNDDPTPEDDGGHGTHNSGIIGAASNNGIGVAGMAWQIRIMPLKVLNSSGIGPDSVIARGIAYAADHGARIINMSFGSSTSSQTLEAAVRYAYDRGAVLIAAAGNTAKLDNATIYPAAFGQVLAVAATDEDDKVGDFSQHHPYVGVSAPGVHIVSTFWRGAGYGSYVSASGTSSAAPHVSGLAALMLSANPTLTNARVRQIIESTADDLGAPGKDEYYGTGRINARKALQAARPGAQPTLPATTPAPATAPSPAGPPASLPRTVWYFAEGSTVPPFDTWLLLQNPNAAAVTARITYARGDGSQQTQEMLLPPTSRRSLFVNRIVPNSEFSVKVESDALIFAERALYFGHDGVDSVGIPAPSTSWYLAEGSTRGGFDTRIVLQNPLSAPANVTLSFLTSTGKRVDSTLPIEPGARRSVEASQIVPDADLSTVVTSDQPIIAERFMYFGEGGGHGGLAASQLATSWYLADGTTEGGRDTWLLVLNPNQVAANLKVTYMKEDGSTVVAYHAAAPGSRLSIYANDAVPSARFGVRVESDQPTAVERSTYFADNLGGDNAAGSPLLAQEWYLPEGCTSPPFHEMISVLNPSDRVANLVLTFMKSDGTTQVGYFAASPTSRLTLDVNALLPNTEAAVKVASDVPVVVGRTMYFADGLGGTSSLGIPR